MQLYQRILVFAAFHSLNVRHRHCARFALRLLKQGTISSAGLPKAIWLCCWNHRLLSKEIITTEIRAELAPFTSALKGGGEEVKASAMAYVPNLQDKVFDLLEECARFAKFKYHQLGGNLTQKAWSKVKGLVPF